MVAIEDRKRVSVFIAEKHRQTWVRLARKYPPMQRSHIFWVALQEYFDRLDGKHHLDDEQLRLILRQELANLEVASVSTDEPEKVASDDNLALEILGRNEW